MYTIHEHANTDANLLISDLLCAHFKTRSISMISSHACQSTATTGIVPGNPPLDGDVA